MGKRTISSMVGKPKTREDLYRTIQACNSGGSLSSDGTIEELEELERRDLKLNRKQMFKKAYPIENEMLSIVTQVNPTYNGKEIPHILLTTAGEFDHSGQLLKISNSNGKTKKT